MTQESREEPLRRSPTRGGAACSGGPADLPATHRHPDTCRTSRRRLRVRHQQPAEPPSRKKESTTQKAREGDLQRGSTPRATRRSRGAEGRPTNHHACTRRRPRQRLRDTGWRALRLGTETRRIREPHQAPGHDPRNRNRPRFGEHPEDHEHVFTISRRKRHGGSSKLTVREQLAGPCTIHSFEDDWGRIRSSHTLGDCACSTS